MISISGVFAVTFSVVFAYVADVTTVQDRSRAYGLVSATFAASLVSNLIRFWLFIKYSCIFVLHIQIYEISVNQIKGISIPTLNFSPKTCSSHIVSICLSVILRNISEPAKNMIGDCR